MIDKLFNFFFDKEEKTKVLTIKKENRQIKKEVMLKERKSDIEKYFDFMPNLYEYATDYPSVKSRKFSKQSHDSYLE